MAVMPDFDGEIGYSVGVVNNGNNNNAKFGSIDMMLDVQKIRAIGESLGVKEETMATVNVEDVWQVYPDLVPEEAYGDWTYWDDEGRTKYAREWADKVTRAAKFKRDQAALEELTKKGN